MTGLEASARYGCDHVAPASCEWCADHDDDRRRAWAGGWRFEEPCRLNDREWAQWLTALHGQAQQEPLRGSAS